MTLLQELITFISSLEKDDCFDYYEIKRQMALPFIHKSTTFVSYMNMFEKNGYVFRAYTGYGGLHEYVMVRNMPNYENMTIKTFKKFSDISYRDLYERKFKIKQLINNDKESNNN